MILEFSYQNESAISRCVESETCIYYINIYIFNIYVYNYIHTYILYYNIYIYIYNI